MTVSAEKISSKGPRVSALIAGFWRLQHWQMGVSELSTYVEQLLELGVTTMDHAHVYRSEKPFGDMLKLKPSLREQMQIVTKFGIRVQGFGDLGAAHTNHFDSSAATIEQSVNASLRDLNTDTIDILLVHRPDYLMYVDEVAETFTRLKQAGKVQHFGVSNFTVHQFAELAHVWPELVTNQVEFSPYCLAPLDSGVFSQCGVQRMRPMLWSCLGGGRIFNPVDEQGQRIYRAVAQVQQELGAATLDAVVYAWVRKLACKPLPILGTHSIERVKHAVASLDLTLSREQWYRIWEAANGAPVP